MYPERINSLIEIPEEKKSISVKESEAAFMYNFIKEKNIKDTLEIGFAFGRSATHIVSATKHDHHVIDPFQDEYNDLGLKNIEKIGYKNKLHFYNDFSHNVLPELCKKEKKFEFILIDGDHKFDGIFVDFYYADLLLKDKGYALFHDTWMRSTQLVLSFIRKNRKDYKILKTGLRNIVLVQKIGKDGRNGMHFKGFYTLKSWFTHKLIMWMSYGKETGLKKLAMTIKEKVK